MPAAIYDRTPFRFAGVGLGLNAPADVLPLNRVPFLKNVREYQLGVLSGRAGTATIAAPLPAPINAIGRLNDAVAGNSIRVYGLTNGAIYTQVPGGAVGSSSNVDSAYSGNPVTIIDETPPRSPEPWAYIADSARMRKINTAAQKLPWGLGQGAIPPSVQLDQPALKVISAIDDQTAFTLVNATSVANLGVVGTTIASILYDSGATGYCSIAPTAFTNIIEGDRIIIAAAETCIVDQITIAIASTTIEQIVYDIGSTGLCTIQPTSSLGVGQTVAPPLAAYQARYGHPTWDESRDGFGATPWVKAGGVPTPAPDQTSRPVERQIDFPVNCLVTINTGGGTAETVRILSVSVGTDGRMSFRCSAANTHAAGETLTGVAAFRCYTTGTRAAGNNLTVNGEAVVITPTIPAGASQVNWVGGIASTLGGTVDASLVANASITRATLPDDLIHLAIKVDALQAVNGVRIYLDVDDSTYLRNYYFFEWRANDIIRAIQTTNGGPVDLVLEARASVVTNAQIDPTLQTPPQAGGDPNAMGLAANAGQFGTAPPATQPVTDLAETLRLAGLATTDPVNGAATSSESTSGQLALANNQWVCLRCRVGDLTRVGEDTTLTLRDTTAAEILIDFTATATVANPLNVSLHALYVQGGFGPNAGDVGVPYTYVAVPRDGNLGIIGNPSPPSRGGVIPRRQRVFLTPPADMDANATLIDWYALGGLLDRYAYIGTSPNDASVFSHVAADVNVVGGTPLILDNFQPWPTTDLPRKGVALLAGSAMQRVSGDLFNLSWAPGTAMVVNGFTVLIDQVLSTSRLLLRGNAGAGATVAWVAANPTLLGQPLPACWGDRSGVYFACGDPNNPGSIYWCKPNILDQVSDAANTLVTGGSERLQNGYIYDTESYAASTNAIYRMDDNGLGGFVPRRTAGAHGFWTRWSFCVDEDGCWFLADDGIYVKSGGAVEQSVSDADLYPLFPHDGLPGVTVNGVAPPDMAQTNRLRLSSVDDYIYFDFADTAGHDRTLIYSKPLKAWYYDDYGAGQGVYCRFEEPGAGVHDQVLGVASSTVKQYVATAADDGVAIAGALSTRYADGGDARRLKQFGDAMVKADTNGVSVTVQPIYDDGSATLGGFAFSTSALELIPVDLNGGQGQLARNLGLNLTWASTVAAPEFDLWEPSFVPKAEDVAQRATDWDDLGYPGAKFVQGVVIRANTYGNTNTITIEGDGATQLSFTINHNGEIEKAYPLSSAGWTPFIAQLVRLFGDGTQWQLYALRWVYEPAPEEATEWTTQPTTHDAPGYLTVRDLVIAYSAAAPVVLSVQYDLATPQLYPLPATSGANYDRAYITAVAGKGRSVVYSLTSVEPFRLYQRDCAVRVQPWGGQSGYSMAMPFGGPSRVAGAQI